MGLLLINKSRVKYIGWIIKRKSLSCHHLQGRRLPRSGTTQSLKEEKYSLAVAKSLAGGSWENCKNWPSFAAADSGEYPWPVRFWKNSLNFALLFSLRSKQSVSHKILLLEFEGKLNHLRERTSTLPSFLRRKVNYFFLCLDGKI